MADAAGFELHGRRFPLIIVPMQTIQLLADATARAGFLASARDALEPGGLVALALADALETFDEYARLPAPDLGEVGDRRYVSQPVAVREQPRVVRIERVRQTIAPDGTRASEADTVELARLSAAELEAEAVAAGLHAEPSRLIEPTDEHVGSEVVLLRG